MSTFFTLLVLVYSQVDNHMSYGRALIVHTQQSSFVITTLGHLSCSLLTLLHVCGIIFLDLPLQFLPFFKNVTSSEIFQFCSSEQRNHANLLTLYPFTNREGILPHLPTLVINLHNLYLIYISLKIEMCVLNRGSYDQFLTGNTNTCQK